jgi:hypothetical protein
MNAHDWFVEHRDTFVIRGLEPEEERVFLEHLAGCAECRDEITRLERDLRWLPMGVEPTAPRPGLKRRLVEGALGTRGRRVRWAVPIAAAAALALAAGTWWTGRAREQVLQQRVAQLRQQLDEVRDTLSIISGAGRVLQASITMDGHQGGLMIFADTKTHRWNVVVHGLPPAHPGEVYQFWFICSNGMVRGVQIHPNEVAPAFMTLGMPNDGGEVMGAALTVEAASGQSPEPKGKELAHLML